MAFITPDWVSETTSTTGTGDITLAGARAPGRALSSVLANGDTFEYSIYHTQLNEFETGRGTYTSSGNTFARTTVYTSSNANALVNFSAGTKNVDIVQPAKRILTYGDDGGDNSDGATVTLGDGSVFRLITSTTAITAFAFTNDRPGRTAIIRLNTVRTITHNATSLILPGATNITTAVGDRFTLVSLGSGNFLVANYTRADGTPLALTDGSVTLAKMANVSTAGRIYGLQVDATAPAVPVLLTGGEIAEILRFANTTTEATGGTMDNVALDMLTDVWRFTATATVSGIAGGTEGKLLVITNGAAAGSGITVTLVQFATSTSGNRFLNPDSVNVTIEPGNTSVYLYSASRWRCIAQTGTTSTSRASVARAHGRSVVTGGVPASPTGLNVASITDNGVGDITFTFTSAVSTANSTCVCSVTPASTTIDSTNFRLCEVRATTTTTARLQCSDGTFAAADPSVWHFALYTS